MGLVAGVEIAADEEFDRVAARFFLFGRGPSRGSSTDCGGLNFSRN
jgi:hypothetical protein